MPTAELFFMLTRIRNLLLLASAFAVMGHFVFGQCQRASAQVHQSQQRFSINGSIENNDGKLRLVLTNNSPEDFYGVARISLGNNDEQKEVGEVSIRLPKKDLSLLQINGVTPTGDHYTLAIYDQSGGRLFFRIAPLRQISDSTPAVAVTITPVLQEHHKAGSSTSLAANISKPNPADEFAVAATQVQVKTRLLASEDGGDSFTLFFELRSQKPINTAILEIAAAKLKDQKKISINLQSNVNFRLPDSLETDKVNYTLTDKEGRILAKGELNLQKLMDDDSVTVSDIRTDRPLYQSGETVRMTALLDGKSQSGYRVEVSVRDGQSQIIFRDQKVIGKDESFNSIDFSFNLPNSVPTPVVFEFRIFDAETGLLFDSGEREIPMAPAKP
ncbi:MAG TPA: hypothetical protein PLK30_06585 [Blastocatellia bacterium]|nr:hypothetical protein [Blastocatellia bacterium]